MASNMPKTAGELQNEMRRIETEARTLLRVMTTKAAIAQTPKETIWTFNKAKLYRYIPVVPPEQRHRVPLFLVFALMSRPYILDLRPGASFIEYMVKHGYDVYLLDWGVPGPEDKDLKFDDYVLTYLTRAIRKIKAVSGSDEFTMLGWCIGAIASTIYASLRPDDGLKNLILLTAPLDFSDRNSGGFAGWITDSFDADKMANALGIIPGEMLDYGAKALKPVENYIGSYLALWDNLDNPKVVESWHAMQTWLNDLIPMTSGLFRQIVQNLYQQNQLINNELLVRGEQVDLSHIRASLLNVIALSDHISPPCQSESIMDKVGSEDKLLLKIKGGHIGVMAGSGAVKHTWPQIDEWLAARSH